MLSKSCSFELFLRPPPACYNPHGRCGLFDFEVLCSVMFSFSELIKKKKLSLNVLLHGAPLLIKWCEMAVKSEMGHCPCKTLQVCSRPNSSWSSCCIVRIPVNLIWLSTSHFLHCSFGESFANASEVKGIVQPFTRPYVVPKPHAIMFSKEHKKRDCSQALVHAITTSVSY